MSTSYQAGDPLWERVRGIALDYEKPGGTGWPQHLVETINELHDRAVYLQAMAAAWEVEAKHWSAEAKRLRVGETT